MNSDQLQPPTSETKLQARNATIVGSIAALTLGGAAVYASVSGAANQLWSILPIFIASLTLLWLSRTGRHITGSIILIGVITLQTIISPFFESGLGIPGAIGAIAFIGGIGLAALPRQHTGRVLILSLLVGSTSVFIDLFAAMNRPASGSLEVRWMAAVILFIIYVIYFIRKFSLLDIRTKIVLGILATGGVSLVVLALFSVDRAARIVNSLSERLETSVRLQAEETLVNTATLNATLVNDFFETISRDVEDIASHRVSLESQKAVLGQGLYWDAATRLFQFKTGQIGNSQNDISSVFIPINTEIDEALLVDLNTSAYLDFSVPKKIETNPAILAIYYIDINRVTRYYPNINLASLLPPDFDATQRTYFEITSPVFNPRRLTRWAIPYVDAAGGGLVVTVASPVYFGNEFNGVVAADLQLSRATDLVSSLKIGQTGYAYMIDDAGRIISLPPQGYAMYGIDPEELPGEEYFKQTLLGAGPDELGSVTRRMTAGGTGLNIIKVDGVDTYISYAPVKTNGYSLALVVPVAEMQSAFINAQNETQSQIRSAIQVAVVIFSSLLLMAILVSFVIGRIIAAPIIRLTGTANQIVAGDINAQASAASHDEIGTLSQAFNTMTSRLRETLAGLEQRVADRTADLVDANEKIERRARQFETISEISRVINQVQTLKDLLPRITQVVGQQFNFYHIGIFLLDTNKVYALLAAANSEGGQRMLARNHKLKVGQEGIVGNVAANAIPRIALDTGADAVYFNNPDLPETHSEMALPLFGLKRQIIGVMDVQSIETNAFSQEDVQVLSTLAEQVSVAIANARLYEETQRALSEAETLYRGDLRTGWQKFTKSMNLSGIRRTGTKSVLLSEPVNVPGFESVSRTGNMIEIKSEDNQVGSQITLPIKLRGEVVGVLNLRSHENREWTKDQLDIINAIIERAALSIESSRLLTESQKQAAKERVIGEIASKVSSFSNRDNILQAAVTEIGRSMPGAEITIQFQRNNDDGARED